MVKDEYPGPDGEQKAQQAMQGHKPHLQYGWASPEMTEDILKEACIPRPRCSCCTTPSINQIHLSSTMAGYGDHAW